MRNYHVVDLRHFHVFLLRHFSPISALSSSSASTLDSSSSSLPFVPLLVNVERLEFILEAETWTDHYQSTSWLEINHRTNLQERLAEDILADLALADLILSPLSPIWKPWSHTFSDQQRLYPSKSIHTYLRSSGLVPSSGVASFFVVVHPRDFFHVRHLRILKAKTFSFS